MKRKRLSLEFSTKPFLLSHTWCKFNHIFSHNKQYYCILFSSTGCDFAVRCWCLCADVFKTLDFITKPSDHPTPGERQRAPNARTHTHFITVHHTVSADEACVLCCRLRHLFKPHVMKLWRETEERASLTGGFSFSTYSQTN